MSKLTRSGFHALRTQAAELMAAERVEGLTEALEIVGSY